MVERKVKFVEGEIYHVYNRGNSKNKIFHDEQDYERFRNILYVANGTKAFKFKDFLKYLKNIYSFQKGEEIVHILSYVQMPNHFHLILEISPRPTGGVNGLNKNLDNNISIFMKRVTSAYSLYYNKKYNRSGGLFEGRFKSEHVGNDEYFKYLFSYIHLNPLKIFQPDWREVGILDIKKANEFLQGYKYSSFSDYFQAFREKENQSANIVNKNEFFRKLPENINLEEEIFNWLNYTNIK